MTDPRHEALDAMACALSDAGYTRDTEPEDVKELDVMCAVGYFIRVLIRQGDISYAMEFLTETRQIKNMLDRLGMAMIGYPGDGFRDVACTAARWYGEHLIGEALELLPSKAELVQGTMEDAEINARRESA